MSCSYYTFRQGDYYCMKKQDYVNSDVYYKYCRNYDYSDCPIYKGQDSGGCYLTSACVEARGLPDDCHELQTLRRFRDNWLRQQDGGEGDIAEYYAVAPAIVDAINASPQAHEVWERVYEDLIVPCVTWIEAGEYEKAYQMYKGTFVSLKNEYTEGE